MNRWFLTVVALVVALLGGAYFGAFSCGGYEWHQEALAGVLLAVTAVSVLVPFHRQRPALSRLPALLGVPVMFIIAQAVAAPFYPAAPDSAGGFLRAFLFA